MMVCGLALCIFVESVDSLCILHIDRNGKALQKSSLPRLHVLTSKTPSVKVHKYGAVTSLVVDICIVNLWHRYGYARGLLS